MVGLLAAKLLEQCSQQPQASAQTSQRAARVRWGGRKPPPCFSQSRFIIRNKRSFLWRKKLDLKIIATKHYFSQIFKENVWCIPFASDGKESACSAGDPASIPRLGRSPGEGNGYPLWYSCLGNPMDRGAWQATVHGVIKSRTQLSHSFSSAVTALNQGHKFLVVV